MHPNVDRVVNAATAAGLTIEVVAFPDGTRTADDAARAVGCDVAQIVKSLVFLVADQPVLALVSGANRLDERRLADAAGTARSAVRRADADQVRAATGFPIGGVAPLGVSDALAVYVDEDLLAHDVVWAAAGTPHEVFAVAPGELVAATGGTVVVLAT